MSDGDVTMTHQYIVTVELTTQQLRHETGQSLNLVHRIEEGGKGLLF